MFRKNAGYTPRSDSEDEEPTVSGTKFHVIVVGKTNDAHKSIVSDLKGLGHTEVPELEQCDYVVLFCPVASRVGTDITEALKKAPDNKPVILVVMHHTFNPDFVITDSRRQVNNPNIKLTVDYLFRERKLLTCKRNENSWSSIRKCLRVSRSKVPFWDTIVRCFSNYKYLMIGGLLAATLVGTSIALLTAELIKKQHP